MKKAIAVSIFLLCTGFSFCQSLKTASDVWFALSQDEKELLLVGFRTGIAAGFPEYEKALIKINRSEWVAEVDNFYLAENHKTQPFQIAFISGIPDNKLALKILDSHYAKWLEAE